MVKELINDDRLTPTMRRLRDGSTQLFREASKNDGSFINSDNACVILKHEKRSMYAELIDGFWYWVEGCGPCKGEKRSFRSITTRTGA